MDYTTARHLILVHAGFLLVPSKTGFIGKLRPFQGLAESDFVELAQSLIGVYPSLRESSNADRELITALWEMCYRARILILNRESGVQRNELVSPPDLERCGKWIDAIESFSLRTLQGLDLPMCLSRLLEYIQTSRPENLNLYLAILPEIELCQDYEDPDLAESARRVASMLRTVKTGRQPQ